MNETSLNAECGIDGLSVLAHDLAYFDPFSLQVALKKHIFLKNWDSLHARLNSYCKVWNYKKRSTKRLKHTENPFRKNLQLVDVC